MSITSPFGPRSTALEVARGHDLSGRVALVTGATSGLGVETARALMAAGAQVVLGVRDVPRGEALARDLAAGTGRTASEVPSPEVLPLDLSSLASVRAAADAFLARHGHLDLLVNNAGVMATPFGHTADGFETQFGTNHLGHFVLAGRLLGALRAAPAARVVALSSVGHRLSDVDFADPQFARRPYDKWVAYGQSKTANALFAVGFTERFGAGGLTANAVHPGGIMTGLQKFLPREEQIRMGWMDEAGNLNPVFKTPEQGAATSVWAAVGDELRGVGGLYLEDVREALPAAEAGPHAGYQPYALDPERARQLWTLSEELVGERFG